ncbi:MAG: hypothetical protein AABN33_10745 [Acidobacteriota bacterium]
METAKLILDYLKVFMWPIVVMCALLVFSSDIKQLVRRIQSGTLTAAGASLTFGTGQEKPANVTGKPSPPDVWFSIGETPLSRAQCMEQAKAALTKTGFKEINSGDVTYGYSDQFVGAVWWGRRENSVLITVAGPHEGLEAKHRELQNAFFSGGS